jgi:hypothetical protein
MSNRDFTSGSAGRSAERIMFLGRFLREEAKLFCILVKKSAELFTIIRTGHHLAMFPAAEVVAISAYLLGNILLRPAA